MDENTFWNQAALQAWRDDPFFAEDSVVLAVGFRPRPSLAGELAGAGMELYQVGDGSQVGSVMTAVGTGYTVGRKV